MLILGLLGMYFDAAVVFVTKSSLLFRLAVVILCVVKHHCLKRDKKAVYRICSYCVCVHKILLVKVGFLIKPYIRNLFPNFLLNSILFQFENEIWNVFCPVHIFGFVKSVTYIHPNSVSKSGVEVFLHECEIYLLCDMTYFCDIERAYYFWNMCTFTYIKG